jgi:N utilization substance protein B
MSRRAAREIAFHIMYEYGYSDRKLSELLNERMTEESFEALSPEIPAYQKPLEQRHADYLANMFGDMEERLSEIDATISKYSKNWNFRRISRVATAILRIAIYELKYNDDVPPKVSINEAVELAKKYDTQESASFINGILASVYAERMGVPPEKGEDEPYEDDDEPELDEIKPEIVETVLDERALGETIYEDGKIKSVLEDGEPESVSEESASDAPAPDEREDE